MLVTTGAVNGSTSRQWQSRRFIAKESNALYLLTRCATAEVGHNFNGLPWIANFYVLALVQRILVILVGLAKKFVN
jgi:hypothetical protein